MIHKENTTSLSMAINTQISNAMIEISCGQVEEAHRRLHFIRTVLLCTNIMQGQRINGETLEILQTVSNEDYNKLYNKELELI